MKRTMEFLDDIDKMKDLEQLTKEEFLKSYSYLTEKEYNYTKLLNDIILNGIGIAVDNQSNFADVYVGGWYYEEYCNNINEDIDFTDFIKMIITDMEKDNRVREIAGITYDDTLDIVFTDESLKEWEMNLYGK